MKDHFENFSKANVLVVGDVMLDRYWWGTVNRISPEAPVPVVLLNKSTVRPGGAANVAANVGSLGARVRLIGIIGKDDEGDLLIKELRSNGIATGSIFASEERATNVKTRVIAHGQQVTRVDREDNHGLSDSETAEIKDRIEAEVSTCDVVIASDYAKGSLTLGVLEFLVERCRNYDKPLLVDPKGKDFAKYKGATLITPNKREAAEACRLDEFRSDVVQASAAELLADIGFEYVLITEGSEGMTLFGNDGSIKIDADAHQVFDVTGAGDTVIATLGTALASGLDMTAAVELANRAAGISVGIVGAAAVTARQLFAVGPEIHRTAEGFDG